MREERGRIGVGNRSLTGNPYVLDAAADYGEGEARLGDFYITDFDRAGECSAETAVMVE